MATILRFDEPLRFEPFTYLGLDQYEVFIHEEGLSYNYFGFTRIPDELTAGKNLLAFTATENLMVGSEIAIEVLDAMGNLIPCRTADYIGDGLERIYSIEIDERVPQGDATITVMGVAKGRVQYDSSKNLDISEAIPDKYYGTYNIRWQKRLQCNPKKRNSSDIIYFENPDIVVEEVFRPYHTLHYNNSLTSSYSTLAANTSSTYTLCSTGSVGVQNTSASIKYAVQGGKYYIFAESNPDFGGFTDDMIGGTIFFPKPVSPYPSSNHSPYGNPIFNELEDGDGQGDLDTGSQEYSLQGAYNTFIIERLSPLQMRVNSPHTTFQGFGRQNQKEVLHQSFDLSEFRLDWAQSPVSWSNDLASGSNEFLTSYAKITFDKLTPLAGDVTRIKTYVRSDQSANEFQLQADTPVVSQEMLIQTQSTVTRHPAGDFSKFGVSSSVDGTQGRIYWTSSAFGLQPNPDLSVFRAETDAILNPIVDSLQLGTVSTATNLTSSKNHWVVDSTVPMLMQKDQYYQVEFKAYGVNVGSRVNGSPKLGVYIDGEAMSDSTFGIGKLIGEISDIETNQLIASEDYLDNNKSKGEKFTFQADATGFGYLRFKVDNGLWYIAEISVKPYFQFGYTPHHFECFIPTPKANVREIDALDFRFEFYNGNHKKASYTSEIHNLQFENRFTLVATNTYIQSASIDNFFATTPIGDNDWSKEGHIDATMVMEMPEMTESIYHSGSVGIGNFAASTVNYPLHLKKESHEGNTTIKVESYSSSILHLAANQGSTYPNSRSAYVLFDHANTLTSSIIGYTEIEDQDPGGATMSGSTKGSFTIHERNGNVMSFGVGGTSRFHLVSGKSEGFRNAGSHGTFIGHQNPQPGTFDYELDVSGSIAVRSGTLFLPNLPLDTSPPMIIGLDSNNKAVKYNYGALLSAWDDDDWQVNTHYITQSRNTSNSTGKTVWIGDGNVITSVTPNSYMFQLSQSGTSAKIRMEGIPTSISGTANTLTSLIGTLDSGDVYKTDGVGSLYLWKDLTTSITSSVDVFVSGSISASGDIVARSYIVESYTSSQMFSAGGTQFGDSHDDTHSFSGSVTSSGEVSASGTGSFSHLAVPDMTYGVDNSVVIKDSDGVLRTSEIDPRVWGSSLVNTGLSGESGQVSVFNGGTSIVGNSNFMYTDANGLIISNSVSASGTGSFPQLMVPDMSPGVDNSVVIKDSDGVLRTDEIDSRVWGSTLADLTNGVNNRIVTATDANSLNGEANFTFDGTNVQLAASGKHYFRNGNAWIHAPSQSLLEMSASEIVISSSKETYLYGPKVYIQGANSTETFLDVRGNITASGNISSSGNIFANKYHSNGYNVLRYKANQDRVILGNKNKTTNITGSSLTLGDDSAFHVTASGNISASGLLYMSASENAAQTTYNVLVRDPATGLVYHTGSYGVGGTGGGDGSDDDWHIESATVLTSSRSIRVTGSVTSSGEIFAPKLLMGPPRDQMTKGFFGADVNIIQGTLAVGNFGTTAMGSTNIGNQGAQSLAVGAGNHIGGLRMTVTGLLNSSSGHASFTAGTDNVNLGGDQSTILGSSNRNMSGSDYSFMAGNSNQISSSYAAQMLIGLGLTANSGQAGYVVVGRYNDTTHDTSPRCTFEIGAGTHNGARESVQKWYPGHSKLGGKLSIAENVPKYAAAHALDISSGEDHPIKVTNFYKPTDADMHYVWWDKNTKLMHASQNFKHGPATKNIIQFPAGLMADPSSPGFQIVSGSFSILLSGSVSSSNFNCYTSESFAMVIQPDPAEGGSGSSFMITGSGHSGIYFTSSGEESRIGFGTTNPEEEIEFRSDKVRFKQKSSDRGIEMNSEGNFESFAFDTAGASTGSEIILNFARGTRDVPVKLIQGDTLGSIRWVQQSGSLDPRLSGEMATIAATCINTNDQGTVGSLDFNVAADQGAAASANTMFSLNGPVNSATFGDNTNVIVPTVIDIGSSIRHYGDNDTKIVFNNDDINFTVGGVNMLDFIEGDTDSIIFNEAGVDVNFRVESNGDSQAISIDGGNNSITFGNSATTHITASGNISSSGKLIAASAQFGEASVHIDGPSGHITASGNISASGDIDTDIYKSNGQTFAQFVGDTLNVGGGVQKPAIFSGTTITLGSVAGQHVTASGNISASGNIIGADIFLPSGGKISFDDSLNGSDQFIAGNDNNITIDGDNIIKLRADHTIEFQDTSNNAQVTVNPNAGHITSSGNISASGTITANSFVGALTGTATLASGLTGTPDIIVGSLTATSITSSIVTSSIIYTEGSNIFGDAIVDTHLFNGHITASGGISSSGTVIANKMAIGTGNNNPTDGQLEVHGAIHVEGVGGSSNYLNLSTNASSNNNTKILVRGNQLLIKNNADFGVGSIDLDGQRINLLAPVTASGNISSSGTIVGSNLSGTNTGDQDLSALALTANISGSFVAPSASFSTRVTLNDAKVSNSDQDLSALALTANISGSFVAPSASFSTRVTLNDAKVSNIHQTSVTGNAGTATLASGLTGTPDIIVGSLTATSITSSIVTSSIIYTEGSNIFGDAISDTHLFNGNITASGSISSNGTGSFKSIAIPSSNTDYYVGGSGGGAATGTTLRIGSKTTGNTIAMELFHATNPVSLGIDYDGGNALAFVDSVHSSFDSVLQFKTGGSERFRIGALDINTFQIKPAAAANDVEITDNSGNVILYSDTSTQRIGIGTTSPQSKFDVKLANNTVASIGGTISVGSYAGLHFGYSEAGNANYRHSAIVFERDDAAHGDARGNIHILNSSAGSTSANLGDARLTITPSGSVGIGTTTPSTNLVVSSSGGSGVATQILVHSADDGSGNTGASAILESSGWGEAFLKLGGHQIGATGGDLDVRSATDLVFKTNGNNARMYISSSGNVGIGTLTPGEKLEVVGNISSSGNGSFNRAVLGVGSAAAPSLTFEGDTDTGIYQSAAGTFSFAHNGQQRHYITSDFIRSADTTGYEIQRAAGSATDPTYTFRDDNNTGIGRAAADQLSLIAGGVEGIRVTTTGADFNGHVTASGNISSSATITANSFIGDDVTFGSITISTGKIDYGTNADVDTGTENVATATGAEAAFFDYVVKNSTNIRAGTITAATDGTNVEYNETSTVDLGDTSDIKLKVVLSSGDLILQATAASDNWNVSSFIRYMAL